MILIYLQGLKDIAETVRSDLDRSASDGILPDGMDKLEQQRRPLLRFELAHFLFFESFCAFWNHALRVWAF